MALTTQAMAPHRRAFGRGVFFSSYFFITTPAPGDCWLAIRYNGRRLLANYVCCNLFPFLQELQMQYFDTSKLGYQEQRLNLQLSGMHNYKGQRFRDVVRILQLLLGTTD
ncbi:MAG: hypothetical protein CM1200mP18_16490 [Gammaproteobacteria bacterium]|nr:MAG: hypothetical protein CM1200mP18_16490 [Gammaproteobacteria bacterium]